ncbi:multinuclear nonheme iron-dependent oxidase [Streptomyces sp. L7]
MHGGPARAALLAARAHQPVSLHGVGMGLGNAGDGLDVEHVRAIATLADAVAPAAISEHLCFNRSGAQVVNDLLPLPVLGESLDVVCANVMRAQDILKRPLLIENIAAYIDCRAGRRRRGRRRRRIPDRPRPVRAAASCWT